VTHETESRHPDHTRAHELIRDACFLANVGGYEAEGERHKIEELVFFVGHELRGESKPDWIVDTTATHEQKVKSLRAYATQFYNPDSKGGPPTLLSSPEFWEHLDRRSRAWGYLIGATHGEAFNFQRAPHAGHGLVRLLS
jgi:LmbE family N-acetylglucosaminyl deacetylase